MGRRDSPCVNIRVREHKKTAMRETGGSGRGVELATGSEIGHDQIHILYRKRWRKEKPLKKKYA